MLEATEFDLKTGKTLTEYDPHSQSAKPKTRDIDHAYLEHWLTHHDLSNRSLWTAKFYAGVNADDQQRLEQEGKVLVFANAEKGYFTDPDTARLMSEGDPQMGISPLYNFSAASAHDLTAYGSLLVSDGLASTVLNPESRSVRMLVVDEEQRDAGQSPLLNSDGETLSSTKLDALFERLGDGTLLVESSTLRSLVTSEELEFCIRHHLEDSFPSTLQIEQLVQWYQHEQKWPPPELLPLAVAERIDDALEERALKTVSQFRAATPDHPGMLKGTLSASDWVEELDVDVICSVSTLKGDGGELSTPGIHEVSQLWLNRKLDGRYNTQAVGSQLKGTIPNATAHELNPRVLKRAEAFAQIAGNAQQLAEDYVTTQAQQRAVDPNPWRAGAPAEAEADWLSQLIQQDRYGVMSAGFPTVVDKLERFVRHERIDQALRGIRIPSAMAQPHAQLKPWEVCNRNLPEGAIVAYYRSPIPSISAVALAINNPNALQQADREAYRKRGVSYLNPWTAQNVAITDFDGDVNGYFVGYLAKETGLAQQVRDQLQATDFLSPVQQYEAARQLFAELVEQLQQQPAEALIQPGDYPQTVAEVIERTAPERKPPDIAKQPKVKHPWRDDETLAEATWQAWSLSAENPIGRVANAGMILQSFASECLYARSDEIKEVLLQQISSHFQTQLHRATEGKLEIPSNEVLISRGFPAYDLKPRFQSLAQAGATLRTLQDPNRRQQHMAQHLKAAHDLFSEIANGPNAANLQTAVDSAKSARVIDETMHRLALVLQYKPHRLRQHRKDPTVYTAGRVLPTNTDEPISWMVESVNQLYQQTALQRASNVGMRFGALMDGIPFSEDQSRQAERIVTGYLTLMKQRSEAQRQQQRHPTASRQPSLTLTSPQTGRTIRVERLIDATAGNEAQTQDLWRTSGATNWQVLIEPVQRQNRTAFVVKRVLAGSHPDQSAAHLLGWVSDASTEQQNLGQFFQRKRQLRIASPLIEVHPPQVLQNDAEALLEKASRFLTNAKATIPKDEQAAYAAAMWSLKLPTGERVRGREGQTIEKQAKLGMAVALQLFPEAVGKQLQQLPPLTLSGTRYREATPEPGEQELVTLPYQYLNKAGYVREAVGISWSDPQGDKKHLGFLGERSLQLPVSLKLRAALHIDSQKPNREQVTVQIKELLGRDLAISSSRNVTDSRYAPTYQELQDWWRWARGQRDEQKMEAISQLGSRLVNFYQSATSVQESPPSDYRDVRLVLTAAQREEMRQELENRVEEQQVVVVRSAQVERDTCKDVNGYSLS